MPIILKLSLPITDPVLIFALVLFIILIFPTLFKKLHLPEIIGLIIAGVIVGPHGFNLLSQNIGLSIFSQTGLLYLMFLAGLEINVREFLKNKTPSLTFGFLIFTIPFVFSGLLFYYGFKMPFLTSLLISSMVASHTLVAYPIVGRFGINRNRVINVIVGGTIIADTIALLILAVVSESVREQLNHLFWIKLTIYFIIFLGLVLWFIPKVSKWFFKKYYGESSSEYIFVLAMVFLAAVISRYAHIEPIIGAFFAGLALSKLIPRTSPLMNRIEFIGNTIFIPFFLITVGMLIDLKILSHSWQLLLIIFALVTVAIFSKFLAAFITQKLFRYNVSERNLMFGLSTARAASAIAIVLIGFNLNLVNETIVNATIILILISTLVSSFVTQQAAKKIAVWEENEIIPNQNGIERILIPISNPERINQLVSFAILVKDKKSKEPLYPLTVVDDDEKATENVVNYMKILKKAEIHASSSNNVTKIIPRIDTNVADGIARTVKELLITKIILGWHSKMTTKELFFGSLLKNVLDKTGKTTFVININSPLNVFEKIHVVMPPAAELEIGFNEWIDSVLNISRESLAKIYFWGNSFTHEKIKQYISNKKVSNEIDYRRAKCIALLKVVSKRITKNDLLIVISARKNTLSYDKHIRQIPYSLDVHSDGLNVVVIYPEQEIFYKESFELQI